ncbi:MAG TPA: cyclopropane-fatty-acyl-phospholipid synthase family protein [Xanthobacteraceae bacterium]|jgi:cyclopropane-fatty-acyl-phospholipid synthase|nr:cyclopropane-fatty-acyl-phospholipid synthase family protein [Xanthobacteraceae bacterium]
MDWLLRMALAHVTCGNLHVTTARGAIFTFGDGTGPPIAVRFVSARAQRSVLLDPDLRLGEAYMDGTFVVDRGSIAEFLDLVARKSAWPWWAAPIALFRFVWRRIGQFNWRGRSRRNVAHHYDLDGRLYSLFLDSDRQYSCAYFETPEMSLDDAQLAKKRHLAAKLILEDGHRLLDIGCGWGGLALYAAEMCGAHVTGITLSQEQLAIARQRARERKLDGSATFHALDYRDVTGTFDRIVSVGMFEHVGVGFYDAFFTKCSSILADDGVMVLHSIGRSSGPGYTNAWIAKYIFPGGYIPALSEVLPAIERAGLLITDIEILRLHYAETLKAWRDRFLAHRDEVVRLYDARFVRMWEFYLACSEAAFRRQNMMVLQIQLAKRQGIVPITRDYIQRSEARLRGREAGRRTPLRLAGE